jgi:beta-lactamase regulating signal transducer with metallopeptidase domain
MSELMRTLISMSLSGAVVTVVLLVMKPLTRKHLSQRWQYYVWLLVVLRLLLPLAPTVTVPSGTLPSVLTRSAPSVVTSVPTTTTPVDTVPGTSLPTGEPATSTETSPQTLPVTANGRTTWPASTLLLLIWAIGALAVMIWNIAGYTRFKRTVQRTMVRVPDAHFLAILEDCRQEVHVRATPRLYTSASVASPILLGILHPAIVLPDRQLTDNDLRYALLHELTHARRQDGLLKWIAAIAVSIHWFNPLAYVMQYELNHSCELSCDETVTRQFSTDDRRGYGSMLLAVASAAGAPSPAMFSAMVEDKRNLKERLGVVMSSNKQTKRTTVVSVMSIALVAALAIVAGCTPKAVPIEGPDVSALMLTNVTASAYDAVPLTWSVGQNTLQSTGTTVLHANNTNGEAVLRWRSGLPLLAVQQWSYKDKLPLMTSMSKDLTILVPRVMPAASNPVARWSVLEDNSFVTTPSELYVASSGETLDERSMVIGEDLEAEAIALPSGLTQILVLYGSGNLENGFVLIEASEANAANNTLDSALWLLRRFHRVTTWIRCGDLSEFDGNLIAGQDPSIARVGSLLYFTHSHMKIGCIDTAATSPSVTFPETINTLLAKLYREGPTNAEWPLQAQLASDNGTLIIAYPDANWNGIYYAVNASGTVLGSLRADKTSVTSFDANGKQGATLPLKDALNNVRLPSLDLFQVPIF